MVGGRNRNFRYAAQLNHFYGDSGENFFVRLGLYTRQLRHRFNHADRRLFISAIFPAASNYFRLRIPGKAIQPSRPPFRQCDFRLDANGANGHRAVQGLKLIHVASESWFDARTCG